MVSTRRSGRFAGAHPPVAADPVTASPSTSQNVAPPTSTPSRKRARISTAAELRSPAATSGTGASAEAAGLRLSTNGAVQQAVVPEAEAPATASASAPPNPSPDPSPLSQTPIPRKTPRRGSPARDGQEQVDGTAPPLRNPALLPSVDMAIASPAPTVGGVSADLSASFMSAQSAPAHPGTASDPETSSALPPTPPGVRSLEPDADNPASNALGRTSSVTTASSLPKGELPGAVALSDSGAVGQAADGSAPAPGGGSSLHGATQETESKPGGIDPGAGDVPLGSTSSGAAVNASPKRGQGTAVRPSAPRPNAGHNPLNKIRSSKIAPGAQKPSSAGPKAAKQAGFNILNVLQSQHQAAAFDLLLQNHGIMRFEDNFREAVRRQHAEENVKYGGKHGLPRLTTFGSVFSLFPRPTDATS
ncbi:hypothetical protein JCM3774_001225 [Rhodotorula dairenensis]